MIDKEIELLAAHADRNETTFFQITYFLIGQEPTDQAKLHKCIHEISGRLKSIRAAQNELAELADIAELQMLEIGKLKDGTEDNIKKRMMMRKTVANSEQCQRLTGKIQAWEREIDYLHQIYKAVSERTPLKPWGSYDVQMEYWNEKLRNELRTRNLLALPIDMETVKAVLSLPDTATVKEELKAISLGEDK